MPTETHIIVRGRVQGVGFRFAAQRAGRTIGVSGFVRNLANGDVEIVAQGDPERVERMIDWARRGPPAASVEKIEVESRDRTATFRDFDIR